MSSANPNPNQKASGVRKKIDWSKGPVHLSPILSEVKAKADAQAKAKAEALANASNKEKHQLKRLEERKKKEEEAKQEQIRKEEARWERLRSKDEARLERQRREEEARQEGQRREEEAKAKTIPNLETKKVGGKAARKARQKQKRLQRRLEDEQQKEEEARAKNILNLESTNIDAAADDSRNETEKTNVDELSNVLSLLETPNEAAGSSSPPSGVAAVSQIMQDSLEKLDTNEDEAKSGELEIAQVEVSSVLSPLETSNEVAGSSGPPSGVASVSQIMQDSLEKSDTNEDEAKSGELEIAQVEGSSVLSPIETLNEVSGSSSPPSDMPFNNDVDNPEVKVKVGGDAKSIVIDEFGSQRELQNTVSEEKSFCSQTSDHGVRNCRMSSKFYSTKEAWRGDGASMSEPHVQPHSVQEDQEQSAQVNGSSIGTTMSQLQTPNANSRIQERKNMQASYPSGVLNSIEFSNGASGSQEFSNGAGGGSSPPSGEDTGPQIRLDIMKQESATQKQMARMELALSEMQKEMRTKEEALKKKVSAVQKQMAWMELALSEMQKEMRTKEEASKKS